MLRAVLCIISPFVADTLFILYLFLLYLMLFLLVRSLLGGIAGIVHHLYFDFYLWAEILNSCFFCIEILVFYCYESVFLVVGTLASLREKSALLPSRTIKKFNFLPTTKAIAVDLTRSIWMDAMPLLFLGPVFFP